jgi:hypothetical protein
MALGPVATRIGLAEYEGDWSEELSEWSGTDRFHRDWLQIHEIARGTYLQPVASLK